MKMARFRSNLSLVGVPDPGPAVTINEIGFCAWVAQAEPGEVLIYHRGFLAVDADKTISRLSGEARSALRHLADTAFRAAQQDLVHLVQTRIATDRFAYIAIARPKPHRAAAVAASLIRQAA